MPTVRGAIVESAKGVATVVGFTLGGIVFWGCVAGLLFLLTLLFHLI